MNNMDERLNRSNRLPGSEKLTRPEEIGQLSKYLKSIKEVYEESTRLEDQVLGISGRSTGKIPVIDSLEKKSIKAPENQGERVDLSRKILGVPGKKVEERLENKRLDLEKPKTPELNKTIVRGPENYGGSVDRLEDVIKKIQDVRNNELEDKRINLLDERNLALEDTRLNLQAMVNSSLENKRIDLEGIKDVELEDKKVSLKDVRETELTNKRVDLEDRRDVNLSDKILNLKKPEEVELGNKRLDIQDERITSLENKRVDISAEENLELEDKQVRISDNRNTELEDKKINISDDRDLGLDDKKVKIFDDRDPELEEKKLNLTDDRNLGLGNKKVKISDERNLELGDKRLGLYDDRNSELSNKKIELRDDRDLELGNKRIDIYDDQENQLSNKKIGLVGNSQDLEVELGKTRLDLIDDREIGLDDKRIGLEDDRDVSLSDKILELNDDRENSLGDKRIGLEDNREYQLSNKRLDLEDDREIGLGDKRLNLDDDRENRLGDKRLDLEDNRENSLGNKRLDLNDDRENQLRDKRLDLIDNRENELSKKRLDLDDNRENSLGNKRLDLNDDRENQLGDKRLNLDDDRENKLSDKRLDLNDDRENQLEDKRLNLEDSRENPLSDKRLDLEDDRDVNLSDKILELLDDRDPELTDKKIGLEDDREVVLGDKRLDLEDNKEVELEDKILKLSKLVKVKNALANNKIRSAFRDRVDLPENENGEPEELYSQFLEAPDNENGEPEELYSQLLGIPENQGILSNISEAESIKEYTSKLSDSELYEFAMKLINDAKGKDGWLEKVGSIMSAYLSSDILLPKRAIEFRDAINNTLEMGYFGNIMNYEFRQNNEELINDPKYKDSILNRKAGEKSKPIPFPESQSETVIDGDVESLKPNRLRVPIDTTSGSIWAKAEELVDQRITGTNRRDALDEMIVKLVDYKRSNLPKLPGTPLEGNAKDVVKNVAGVITGGTGGTSHMDPMNKPLSLNGEMVPGGYGDTLYQAANNRVKYDSIGTEKVGDLIGDTFYNRYWKAASFKTTLEDLCPIVGKAPVVSLTELKAILKASPYFTSPGKFMTDTKGSYNTFSLDTNMYWEVTIEPFCCNNGPCSNGGYSFLPSIREINFINKKIHGVSTNYGYWAPINSFELQKSKLTTKTLPLYEGEITYPTGMEFTNELRLTFVDDAWKSWKRYFERCAEVAVYNSIPHTEGFYNKTPNLVSELTRIDKTNICIASYKNLAFKIKIYILNPQLNLLNRFCLLCVLKDYAEEYVGEVDSGGTDLNVSFSIVGENPTEDFSKELMISKEVAKEMAKQAALEAQKRVTGAINSSVGLI